MTFVFVFFIIILGLADCVVIVRVNALWWIFCFAYCYQFKFSSMLSMLPRLRSTPGSQISPQACCFVRCAEALCERTVFICIVCGLLH